MQLIAVLRPFDRSFQLDYQAAYPQKDIVSVAFQLLIAIYSHSTARANFT